MRTSSMDERISSTILSIDSRTWASIEPATSSPRTAINPPDAIGCRTLSGCSAASAIIGFALSRCQGNESACYRVFVRRFALILPIVTLLAGGCADRVAEPDHQSEWRDVLRHKQAAASAQATPQQKQLYA